MKIAYVGPNKGAGLEMPNSKIVFQARVKHYIVMKLTVEQQGVPVKIK